MSRAIRFFNDGPYSHVAWIDDETGDVYEAWTSGVRKVPSIHHGHTPGTIVDIFAIAGEEHCRSTAIRHFILAQIGKPYDWPGVFRFVTRGDDAEPSFPKHWFCSRLVACAFSRAAIPLSHAPDWKMNPSDCVYSLRCGITPMCTVKTLDTRLLDNRDLRGFERGPDEHIWEHQNRQEST